MKITNENKRFMKTFSVLSIALMLTLAVPAIPLSYGGVIQCTEPPSDMISWWTGDVDATDFLGNNDGTPMGDTAFVPGIVGQAFSFDGDGDYVEVGNDASLNPAEFSVDAWIFIDEYGFYPSIVSKGNVGNHAETFALYISIDGSLSFILNSDGTNVGRTILTGPVVPLDEWHHVAATFDGSTMRIYLDGTLVGSSAHTGINILDVPLLIGKSDRTPSTYSDSFFEGLIDEVEFFDRALEQPEIQDQQPVESE